LCGITSLCSPVFSFFVTTLIHFSVSSILLLFWDVYLEMLVSTRTYGPPSLNVQLKFRICGGIECTICGIGFTCSIKLINQRGTRSRLRHLPPLLQPNRTSRLPPIHRDRIHASHSQHHPPLLLPPKTHNLLPWCLSRSLLLIRVHHRR